MGGKEVETSAEHFPAGKLRPGGLARGGKGCFVQGHTLAGQ